MDKAKSSEQESGYSSDTYLRLTAAEEATYTDLKTRQEVLHEAIDKFEKAHKIPVKDEIAKLLATGSEEVPD